MDQETGTILVVDDNENNRDMLSRRLQRCGYTLEVAENGQEALEQIEKHVFDIILLDAMMPVLDGIETLKILRQKYSVNELPVIMATAKNHSDDIVEALRLGANDYVTKPLDFPVVLARTRTHIALKRAHAEIKTLAQDLDIRNRFIRNLFGRYVNDEVVDTLLTSPQALKLGGENRKVTVIMTDIRGFTALSERLSPEDLISILNSYFEVMIDIVFKYNGTIDEFIGDGILITFGAPVQRDDDSQRAIACALDMQLAMTGFNESNRSKGLPELEIGIGINTGEVVAGNVGSERRAKYSVIGRHVNLAARVESYTTGGQVLISEYTFKDANVPMRINGEMTVEPKGIGRPVILYDIGSISGKYNVSLDKISDTLYKLPEQVALTFNILEGKQLDTSVFSGTLLRLSNSGGEISCDEAVSPLSNIRIQLADSDEELLGEIYGKIIRVFNDKGAGFQFRFTSLSQEAKAMIAGLIDSSNNQSAELA